MGVAKKIVSRPSSLGSNFWKLSSDISKDFARKTPVGPVRRISHGDEFGFLTEVNTL